MSKQEGAAPEVPRPVHRGWPGLAVGLGVLAAAAAVLLITGNTEVERSADGYGATPLWAVLLPAGVGLLLVRAVPLETPYRVERRCHRALRGRPLGLEAIVLVVCLIVLITTGLVFGTGSQPEDPAVLIWVGAKIVLLLLVPLVMFAALRPGWRRDAPRLATAAMRAKELWRWGGAVAVAAYLYLAVFPPWGRELPAAEDLPSIQVTLFVMLATFVTASVLEEIFFRVWLQTRLEILYGRWAGIVLASLAFAVIHIATHQMLGSFGIDLAAVIVVQGAFGLFVGYLWSRFRNVWLILAAHGGINALPLAPALLAGG